MHVWKTLFFIILGLQLVDIINAYGVPKLFPFFYF